MISQTYGHLVQDAEDYLRGLLDEYDARPSVERLSRYRLPGQ